MYQKEVSMFESLETKNLRNGLNLEQIFDKCPSWYDISSLTYGMWHTGKNLDSS